MRKDEYEMRIKNLHPDYEFKQNDTGDWVSINKKTGEVCDCKMKWNESGDTLSCTICGLDGT